MWGFCLGFGAERGGAKLIGVVSLGGVWIGDLPGVLPAGCLDCKQPAGEVGLPVLKLKTPRGAGLTYVGRH